MKAARPINDPTMHVNFLNIGVFLYKILYWVFYKKKELRKRKKSYVLKPLKEIILFGLKLRYYLASF